MRIFFFELSFFRCFLIRKTMKIIELLFSLNFESSNFFFGRFAKDLNFFFQLCNCIIQLLHSQRRKSFNFIKKFDGLSLMSKSQNTFICLFLLLLFLDFLGCNFSIFIQFLGDNNLSSFFEFLLPLFIFISF